MTDLVDARPTRRVYLGLTANPLDALSTVAWTEITAYVRACTLKRGRQHELSRTDPGSATVTLDNIDARFDPQNTAGPYYPNLKPMRRLRFTDDFGNLLSLQQSSFERDIAIRWEVGSNCTVARSTAQAADGAASLAITSTVTGQIFAMSGGGLPRPTVVAGRTYTALGSFRPAHSSANVAMDIWWYNSIGTFLGAAGTGADVAEVGGTFVQPFATAVAPPGAVSASVLAIVRNSVIGEVHYLDKASLAEGSSTTWRPGFRHAFTGYVPDFQPVWSGINRSEVTLDATDALGAVMNTAEVAESLWEQEIRTEIDSANTAGRRIAWYRLGDASDSSGGGRDGVWSGNVSAEPGLITGSGDPSAKFVGAAPGDEKSAMTLPYSDLFTTYPFTIEFWSRITVSTSNILVATLSSGDNVSQLNILPISGLIRVSLTSGGMTLQCDVNSFPRKVRFHLVVRMESSTLITIYLNGVSAGTMNISGPVVLPSFPLVELSMSQANDRLDELVFYDNYTLPTGRITAHHTAGITAWTGDKTGTRLGRVLDTFATWPAVDQALDTGKTTVSAGITNSANTVLDYAYLLETAEHGSLFVSGDGKITFLDRQRPFSSPGNVSRATFGQSANQIGYDAPFRHGVDDADLWNEIHTQRFDGPTIIAKDSTSQTSYGRRVLQRTGLAVATDGDARDLGNWLLIQYKDPVSRVREIVVKPQEDPLVAWPRVFDLELRDRITATASPPGGGSSITQDSHIESVDETVTPKDWTITYGLSVVDPNTYWTVGTSALGSGSRLSF